MHSIARLMAAFFQSVTSPWCVCGASVHWWIGFVLNRIVALGWKGNRGNPVLFPSSLFSALATLAPHQSGSSVIAQYSHLLRIVEAEGPQELLDIDTPADLKYLEQLCVSSRADS